MRVAYLVDVHGRFEAVPQALAEIGDVDLLIVGGDITTGGTPDDAERAIESWRPLAPRLLALAGNMDSAAIDARLAELGVALDGRGFAFDDIGVFGVSAAPRSSLRTPYGSSARTRHPLTRHATGWQAASTSEARPSARLSSASSPTSSSSRIAQK
jgi:hypothetical protein